MKYNQFARMTLDCMRTVNDLEKYSLTDVATVCESAKRFERALATAYPDLRVRFWKEYKTDEMG